MTLKRDWDPLKRILNCVMWVGNMCEDCCIVIIGPKGIWREFNAMVTWRMNAQLLSNPKVASPKEAWICKLWVKLFWVSTTVDLPAACQLSVKWDGTKCHLQVVHSGRGGGGSVSLVKALFLPCPGFFYTTVSLLPHLTVQKCYAVININTSAYHTNIVY